MLRSHSSKPQPLKIVVLGESQGKHYIRHPAVDSELLSRTVSHADETWQLSFMDVDLNGSLAPSYQSMIDSYLATAHGIILMYDMTLGYSFDSVIAEPYLHTWYCRNTVFTKDPATRRLIGTKKRFGCVLVGNKADLAKGDTATATRRHVHADTAAQWAASQGMRHFEITANARGDVDAVVTALVESILRARRMDARDAAAAADASKSCSPNKHDVPCIMSLLKRATKH
ncbi:uncharacterized protein SETTUDRAFT_180383 [Exserohilum turcica Et28A]|uniref:Uncharacterized protein n=1 Tax=Exserohilum turcicum (strain 28A) TaxID=671987 RepID=R0ID72_EXST2|nr:uncharacterized protein SETTUDRAFT_180383 [Exserohilum turcica Et28A]EOA83096.1 hypothetical protein SETTUDRAFT_180383 [Exserohilum turcica Et28A]